MKANIQIVESESTPDCVVIRDLGPWDQFKTVTNDPEGVVAWLYEKKILDSDRLLEYYDSAGYRDQILHKHGKFLGFANRKFSLPLLTIEQQNTRDAYRPVGEYDGSRGVSVFYAIVNGIPEPTHHLNWAENIPPEIMDALRRGETALLHDRAGQPYSVVLMDSFGTLREKRIQARSASE